MEVINGVEHTTSYAYDKDNRVTSVTNGNSSRAYTYDAYSRLSQKLTKHNGNTVLTESLTYRTPSSAATTSQVASLHHCASGYDKTYTYSYDNNGNIVSIGDGTNTTTYVYDSANQLVRENNQAAGKTWVYTYDNAGNITGKKEYAYTTGAVGALEKENTYTYSDSAWGDLLTGYNGQEFITDEIGNILNDGTWHYTWQHGRQLAQMQMQTTDNYFGLIVDFKYNADGLRTEKVVTIRTSGFTQHIVTYRYAYNGSQLVQETVTTETIEDNTTTTEVLYYAYDASGSPLSITLTDASGTENTYYYAVNIQGDVTAILTTSGTAVVEYTYDAWGNHFMSGDLADTLGKANSLRYRGYVCDNETGYYYLQSRYYNPKVGRFINADNQLSTGDITGMNLFSYCGNNPVNRIDPTGESWLHWLLGATVVAACAVATVITCGGFAAAATAVCMVGSGVAAATTASTVAAAAFIGSAAAYGTAALSAAFNSNSAQEFSEQGNWGTVAATAGGALLGGYSGYTMSKAQTPKDSTTEKPKSTGSHTSGVSAPDKNVNPGGSYTKLDDKGNLYSYTQFDDLGRQTMRIDFQGRPHNGVLPHIHLFVYPELGGKVDYVFNLEWHLVG